MAATLGSVFFAAASPAMTGMLDALSGGLLLAMAVRDDDSGGVRQGAAFQRDRCQYWDSPSLPRVAALDKPASLKRTRRARVA